MFWTSSDYPIISRTQFSSAQQKTSPCVVFASIFRRRQSSLCIQIHKTLLKPDTRKRRLGNKEFFFKQNELIKYSGDD